MQGRKLDRLYPKRFINHDSGLDQETSRFVSEVTLLKSKAIVYDVFWGH